jgi:hypothetical protein
MGSLRMSDCGQRFAFDGAPNFFTPGSVQGTHQTQQSHYGRQESGFEGQEFKSEYSAGAPDHYSTYELGGTYPGSLIGQSGFNGSASSGKPDTLCRVMLFHLRSKRADPTQPTIREFKAVSCPVTGNILPQSIPMLLWSAFLVILSLLEGLCMCVTWRK